MARRTVTRAASLSSLVLAIALGLIAAAPLPAEMVQLPGEWYDMDKYTDAGGNRRAWWFYEDLDPAIGHDNKYWWEIGGDVAKHMTSVPGWAEDDPDNPGTLWDPHPFADTGWDDGRSPPTAWNWVSPVTGNTWRPGYDGTCWMASADNVYRYVTGHPSQYDGWAYQGDWPRGTTKNGMTPTWQHGGEPGVCLTEVGLGCDIYGADAGSWSENPADAIHMMLSLGLPVSLGVCGASGDDFGCSSHLITCYGIDRVNQLVTICCSDTEVHGDFGTFSYDFGDFVHPDEPPGTVHANVFHILGDYDTRVNSIRTVAINAWTGSGMHGETAVTGAATEWHNAANWASGHVPDDVGTDAALDESRVPIVDFQNSGIVRVTTADARAARLILSGPDSCVQVDSGGALTLGSLFIRRQGGMVPTGSLAVAGTLTANRADVIDGRVVAAGGSIHVQQADPDAAAANLSAVNMTDLQVGAGGSITVDRNLWVQHEPGAWGVCTISQGAMPTGGTVAVAGDAVIENGCSLTVMGEGVAVHIDGDVDIDGEDAIGNGGGLTVHRAGLDLKGTLYAGRHADAEVRVQGGTLTVGYLFLGYATGTTTVMTMEETGGADPAFRTTGSLVNLYVGWNGDAAVTQNAGALGRESLVDVHPDLWLGYHATSVGTYDLHGGTVAVNDLHLGRVGAGQFVQDGGTLTLHGTLILDGAHATEASEFRLEAGTLNLAGARADDPDPAFFYNGGTLHLTGPTYGFNDLILAAGAESDVTLDIDGQTLTATDLTVGATQRGVVNQSGGIVTAAHVLMATSAGAENSRYNVSGGAFDVTGSAVIGTLARATLDVDGGAAVTAAAVTIGEGGVTGLPASCYHYDGTVDVAGDLVLGGGASGRGYYLLDDAAGNTLTTGATIVGSFGDGHVDQVGGEHTVTGELTVARFALSKGVYYMNGGVLRTDTTAVSAGGDGTFTHDSGTHQTDVLRVGAGSDGLYEMRTPTFPGKTDPILIADTQYVGDGCTGTVTQADGANTATVGQYLGHAAGSVGLYEQSGGSTAAAEAWLGYAASSTGTYTLTGGSHEVDGDMHVGYGDASAGSFAASGGGDTASRVYGNLLLAEGAGSTGTCTVTGPGTEIVVDGETVVGHAGAGTLRAETSGAFTANGPVTVGGGGGGAGLIEMDGGKLGGAGTVTLAVGLGSLTGRGWVELPVVNHHAITATGDLAFWAAVTGDGAVAVEEWGALTFNGGATLDGPVTTADNSHVAVTFQPATLSAGMAGTGSLSVGSRLDVQSNVTAGLVTAGDWGTIAQHGGTTVTASGLGVGVEGLYELQASGSLEVAGEAYVNGLLDQQGGTATIDTLRVDGGPMGYMALEPARYRIGGGTLAAGTVELGYDASALVPPGGLPLPGPGLDVPAGELDIADASAVVTISGALVLGQSARVSAVPGVQVHMTGAALENTCQDAAGLEDLANLEAIFEGGAAALDPVEVAGQDRAALPAGLRCNFALGGLTIGGGDVGRVQLADLFDNQPDWDGAEALYVHQLSVGPGSELDLGGLPLYYMTATLDATATVVGTPVEIYVPTTTADVAGAPPGSTITVTLDESGGGAYGGAGMAGGGDARCLSATVSLDDAEIAAALADPGVDCVTLCITYDEAELALLGVPEDTLRPYWWDDAAEMWVLCGTTLAGDPGEGVFAGVGEVPHDWDAPGYCGLDTAANVLWANITHASTYGGGGVTPEPATLALLLLGAAALRLSGKTAPHRRDRRERREQPKSGGGW